jgi:nitroreductase
MEALEALKTRRSVRRFVDQVIPREVLEDLVDCARLAATAINIQPWEFVVVTDRTRLSAIAERTDYGRFIATAAACILVLCKDTKYYLEDGSAATQNLLLAVAAHGLGACWVAGDKKPYADQILRLIGAPEGFKLVSLVPVGFPAERPQPEKRRLADVLHWEKY